MMTFHTANIILQTATLLYFASMIGYGLFLFNQKAAFQIIALSLIGIGTICHITSVIAYVLSYGYFPIQDLSQSLSMAALAVSGMFLFFHYRFELKILGLFVSILISAMMLLSWVTLGAPPEIHEALKGFWFYSHIVLVFTGDAALAMACGAGILYLLQEEGIKSKHPGFFFKRLPSLDLLDNVGYTCITTGFGLLTVGLVAGFIYAKALWGQFWSWDPKEVFSVGTWLVYAALLHLRLRSGWRGKRSAIVAIIGFFIILFTFLGVNLLLGGHHQAFTK